MTVATFTTELLPNGYVRVWDRPCRSARLWERTANGLRIRSGNGRPRPGEIVAVSAAFREGIR
jgi:hypothetical protein